MKRIVINAAVIGGAVVAARTLGPKLHSKMLAKCQGTFELMPEDFPPKKIMGGVEEIRANTTRILELLEERGQEARAESVEEALSTTIDEMELVHA
jgi:hypothetical protein